MLNIVQAVLVLSVMGLVFGGVLAYASRVFAVEVDERIPLIIEVLPGANCGGCGFAGCNAFADAIVNGIAKTGGCPVGGNATAGKVAEIMGVASEHLDRYGARIICGGNNENAMKKYRYSGINDCLSAMRLGSGDKACTYGCIGLGSCVKKCPLGAISIVDGIAVVSPEKCIGCGLCVPNCPKKVISLVPYDKKVNTACRSCDKGAASRQYCNVSCIGCKICEKNCPDEAIKVKDNLAVIDYEKCTDCGICVEKCPRKCITMGCS